MPTQNRARRIRWAASRMKIAIVTDAWQPQVNGVVTTLRRTRDALVAWGHDVPAVWIYAYLRSHHNAASRTLVATERQRAALEHRGFREVVIWPRGVDANLFRPCGRDHLRFDRPIWLYAGRVAVEKNLEAFLGLDLLGSKIVVGAGPDLAALAKRFPTAHFKGYRFGAELAKCRSSADVFVFPSKTDTFGLVMLEALACGTSVAAFPVPGPLDVVAPGVTGALDKNLGAAAKAALELDRSACRAAALERTWSRSAARFLSHLVNIRTGTPLVCSAPMPTPA